MKKLLILLLTFTFALCLCACGSEESKQQPLEPATQSEETATETETETVDENTVLGDYVIVIGEGQVCKDYDGNDCLMFEYTFTNNSKETIAPISTLNIEAFQDGIELERAYMYEENCPREEWVDRIFANQKDIQPGASIECVDYFILPNLTSDVGIEVTDFLNFTSEEKLTKTFTLQ